MAIHQRNEEVTISQACFFVSTSKCNKEVHNVMLYNKTGHTGEQGVVTHP